MHALTKILIVGAAVLALVLSALTVALSTNVDRVKSEFQRERSLRTAAQVDARAQVEASNLEKSKMEAEMRTLETDRSRLAGENSNLRSQLTSLRAEVEQARAEAQSIRNRIDQLGVTVNMQASLITSYREEVTRLREQALASSRKEIDLVDRINDLDASREVLEQTVRALREQLAEATLALQAAEAGQTLVTATPDRPVRLSGPLVEGRVQEVFQSPSGDTMVVINVGSNRGVAPNTEMFITRDSYSTFVANLVVTQVEPARAIARVTLLPRGMTVRAQDVVSSRID